MGGRIGRFWAARGWAPVVLAVAGVAMGAAGLAYGADAARLERSGRKVEGAVVQKLAERTRDADGDPVTRYSVVYRFDPGTGEEVQGRKGVDAAVYEALDEGGPVAVTYLREDPSVSEIVPGETARTAFWLKLVGAVLALAGAVWARRIWRRAG